MNLSFDVPPMKVITQGRILMPNRSTSHGTFSTKTRMKSVLKYLDAMRCRMDDRSVRRQKINVDTHGEVLVHDLTPLEIVVEEMDHTSWLLPVRAIKAHWSKPAAQHTHALSLMTSFSSVTSLY